METGLNEKIKLKKIKVGVLGLGYVGLPLINSMCSKQIKVIGFDIDSNKIKLLNEGKSYLETLSESDLQKHLEAQLFFATDNFNLLADVDIILICVPTPLSVNRDPDLSFIVNTTDLISKTLKKDQLVILESTTYPGCLRDLVKPQLEKTGLKSEQDFYLAYSPEREDPGNINFETSTIPKVIGGDGYIAANLTNQFYELFIEEIIPVTSPETAEAVKITENIFRAVNIALVNELKMIYSKMGVDIWEVIEAAKTKPFGFMPFYPGPGLGGHCIPIDPFYLTWKARELGTSTRFIELAGEINSYMPYYVIEKISEELNNKVKKAVNGSKILILGVAYKKNINDQRESPAFPIIKGLIERGAFVEYYDNHIEEILPSRHFMELAGMKSFSWDEKNLSQFDACVIVTDHDNVDYKLLAQHSSLIIDTRNTLKDEISSATVVKV